MSEFKPGPQYCQKCKGMRRHVLSKAFSGLMRCASCRTLMNPLDPTHTHTRGVSMLSPDSSNLEPHRVVRQEPEEERKEKRE